MRYNYVFTQEKLDNFKNSIKIGDFYFYYDSDNLCTYSKDNSEVLIFGDCFSIKKDIDTSEDMIKSLSTKSTLGEILAESKYLSGRYLIIVLTDDQTYIIPDAINSIQVNYTNQQKKTPFYVSSHSKIIANICGFKESEKLLKVKNVKDDKHVFPTNLTPFEKILKLQGNHILSVEDRDEIRIFPVNNKNDTSVEEAVELTELYVKSLLGQMFEKDYMFYLPLTSGVDSRTVLSFFNKYKEQIHSYTFNHDYLGAGARDITTPKIISSELDFKYKVLAQKKISSYEILVLHDSLLSENINKHILNNSYTLNQFVKTENFNNEKIFFLSGDIIPIVKSNFGRNLPNKFATTLFLSSKTYNYSFRNFLEIRNWKLKLKQNGMHGYSVFDLFFWEHRIANWTVNNIANYDIYSNYFNLFNNRHLIETWISVPNKERRKYSIQKKIIYNQWPELHNYEYNLENNKSIKTIVHKNTILYYISSVVIFLFLFLKYQFYDKKRKNK